MTTFFKTLTVYPLIFYIIIIRNNLTDIIRPVKAFFLLHKVLHNADHTYKIDKKIIKYFKITNKITLI